MKNVIYQFGAVNHVAVRHVLSVAVRESGDAEAVWRASSRAR
jgi:hypothetical protein